MKKLVSLLLALCMLLSVTGALAAEDGKITIWTWDPNFNIAAMKVAKDMYAAINPNVEVVIEEVLSEDIETRVITAASAGDISNLPDIMLCQDNSFQKMVMNYPEVYANITGQYDFEGFPAGKLAYSTVNGQNHGIPFDAGTVVGTYRTDFLEQAGYTIADLTDIDWDRFIEIGKDVKAKTGLPMLTGQAGSIDTVLIMMQSCGASMFNEDGSVNFVNNEACQKVLEYYKTMVTEGIFVEVNTWDEYCGTLANSSCVGTINGCWILGTIMGVPEFSGKWALTNMPKMPGFETATNYSNNGGSSWVFTTAPIWPWLSTSCRCTATLTSTTRSSRPLPPSAPGPARRKAPTTLLATSTTLATRSSRRSLSSPLMFRPTRLARTTTTPAALWALLSPTTCWAAT